MLGLTFALATGLSLRAPPPRRASARPDATVLFVVPGPGGRRSPFGATSPAPSPEWHAVGSHLASRLSSLSEGGVAGDVLTEEELLDSDGVAKRADIIIALGLSTEAAPSLALQKRQVTPAALVSYDCAPEVDKLSEVGAYTQSPQGVDVALQPARTALVPWGRVAQGQRLFEQAAMLLERNSSEDLLYALFFMIHGLGIAELDLVKYTVNPTWEKGPVRNAAEFASMCTKCARKIRPRSVVVRARARGVNIGVLAHGRDAMGWQVRGQDRARTH